MSSRRSGRRSASGGCARSISPAPRRPGARATCCTTSASTPIAREALESFVALPPSTLEKRERLEQLRALEAGMRIDIALVDVAPLGVDTPEDLQRARETAGAREEEHHDEPSRKSPIRASRARIRTSPAPRIFPSIEPLPCATFEDAFAALRDGARRARHDPDREFDRRPGRRHSQSAAGLEPAHHRRDLSADPFPAARPAGRRDLRAAQRAQPCPRARPVPEDHPRARPEAGRRRRHRGLGARSGGGAAIARAPRWPPASPAKSTG